MVFLHFMACFWVGLGRKEGGWVSVHRPGASDVEQQHGRRKCWIPYFESFQASTSNTNMKPKQWLVIALQFHTDHQTRYGVAFHWALAQFHGTMELYPYTLEEFGSLTIVGHDGPVNQDESAIDTCRSGFLRLPTCCWHTCWQWFSSRSSHQP